MKSAFLIAAPSSGNGKTTFSLGLMRALTQQSNLVQPFKCGPDYIDTQFQSIAVGREAINLDLFMASDTHVKELFNHYSASADVSIVEGAMGMFDGFNGMEGSSAHIAMTIDIPMILLINAASTAYSVAATIFGFTRFNPKVNVAGVVFNNIGSENHFSFMRKACENVGVECFGYLKKKPALQMPSRHLGLTLSSKEEMNRFIDLAAYEVSQHINIEKLLTATKNLKIKECEMTVPFPTGLHVAVAYDAAFNFLYPANLKVFKNISFFSPLHDKQLPPADILYFPGGYPELFASELETNREMRENVRAFAESGGKILGECGGLIYLCNEIDGHKMCGVFTMKATMSNSSLTLGYRVVRLPNIKLYGHEFHYSHISTQEVAVNIASQSNAKGTKVDTPLYRYKNTIAGYTHLYWAESDILKLWNK